MGHDQKDKLRVGGRNLQTLKPGRPACGFSLLELLVSMAILMVISGSALVVINYYQKSYGRTQLKAGMYEDVRGVAELMAQEIGQAGLVSLPTPPPTLSAAVAVNTVAQAVNVSSTTSMFVGEQLLVDTGANEETVALTAITPGSPGSISAIFTKAHVLSVPGVPLNVLGVVPSGIVPPGTTDGSTANVLKLVGDINADGSLVYVRYTCTPGTSATPGTLTRSITTITPGVNTITIGASQTLLSTVVGGVGTACFIYPANQTAAGFTFVGNVGFTVSVQTTKPDPQSRNYLTMTKSFLNLAPRNVLIGFELASAAPPVTNRLQPAPPNVLVY